ncbi:hypothetical protein UFOVP1082_2 [uncultured Caudovirales phage]|uniref:Terminase n=1 Tax=uncultured Caudovirales phage TaxID=2100421 RepID=A0A6J5QMS7_9CAUD|nr:hypothetical protein UFOVP906_39 [uncultured Caudovirales phage]CAB4176139.1 hypothetical protein UFOVP992_6 [uncultured Caudovirales phage]CAB4182821.1 hypothetical protein UFOVP1082_2 [uncultured Caudovirales phage]CAB4197878.1 hypothetical protein UFOVP1322_46 [uncultured Caudovirales phage]CAB4212303.1 hypothetical protein UFOVP1434_9 [uncultured Caudovirales phage]
MALAAQSKHIDLATTFIERVRADPVWFAEHVLNHRALDGEPSIKEKPDRSWELDQFQRDLLNACADVWRKKKGLPTVINHEGKNYITVRSGHGPGKTHTAALIAHWFNTAFPGRIVCTAPKLAQLRTRVWSSLRKIDARAEPWYRTTHVIHDTTVNWLRADAKGKLYEDKNWCILGETATHPENMAGHHERYQCMIVEEATGVGENLWPTLFGALSTGEFQLLVMISNPSKTNGTFADSHLKPRDEAQFFRYHVNLNNAQRIDRKWVESMRKKYGETSTVFKIRCLGEFADASDAQLIPLQWVMDSILTEKWRADGSGPKVRVSVDVADGGVDETVITVSNHFASKMVVLAMRRFSFASSEAPIESAKAAEQLFHAYGGMNLTGDDIVVDSLGVGAGTAGWLLDKGYNVVTYKGGESSDVPSQWRNRRVQSYINLRNAFRDRTIEFAQDSLAEEDWDDLIGQLCSIESDHSRDRVEDLLTKEEMKRKGIKSPDMADSLAMQYATQMARLSMKMELREEYMPEVIHNDQWGSF